MRLGFVYFIILGVAHGDELSYLFDFSELDHIDGYEDIYVDPLDESERNVSHLLTTLWTDFAYTG